MEFDQLADLGLLGHECGQGLVEDQQFVWSGLRNQILTIKVDSSPVEAAALLPAFASGVID
jgi:hypothetical protein